MSQLYTRSAIHSVLQSPYSAHYQFDNTYTSRDTAYPNSAVAISDDRQYEGQGWKVRSGHTMSDSRPKDYDTPRRVEPAPRREQLPSISSLFSGPTQPTQPVQQSSQASRPSHVERNPSYSTTSPQDTRRTGTPLFQDRSYQEPYQRQPQADSGHFIYPSRTESERTGLPPPSKPIQSAVESPRSYDPRHSPYESNRTQISSSSRWSPRSEPGAKQDYLVASKDASSTFQTPVTQGLSHQPPASVVRGEQDRVFYRETPLSGSAPSLPQYPLTPVSSAPVELNTSKDALGPKIWTGTQFLPRFMRQQEVPGEGLCFFYDDGTHCKAVIDGEPVNAYWGVTKAGKPRKRLAIACITCREKKIKCDPDYPRCVQCEKFGRICKFKNAPRGGQGSPETPPAEAEELNERSHQQEHGRRESQKSDYDPLKYETATSPSDQHSAKRRKHTYTNFTPLSPGPAHEDSIRRRTSEILIQDWHTNPMAVYPSLVQELIPLYFSGLASTSYIFLPSEPMKYWIFSSAPKSLDDLMLIYSMLAIGSKYSGSPEHQSRGEEFYAIANYATEHMPNSLQLCQTRLNLACYSYSTSRKPGDNWEFCTRAVATASAIKLNIELSVSQISAEKMPYGLSLRGYLECRRRTFWSCYIMDRFNSFGNNHLSFIHPEDIFLRLPLSESAFNAQLPNDNPFFTPNIKQMTPVTDVGPMGYLIGISSIWGDVMANIYRWSNRPPELPNVDPSIQRNFYDNTISNLQVWRSSLPAHLQPIEPNFGAFPTTLGTWMTMHMLYHATHIKLNRYVRVTLVSPATIEQNISQAIAHSREVLRMVTHPSVLTNPEFSTPFASYPILTAIDILSSRGSISQHKELLERFKLAICILEKLARYWAPAAMQLLDVQKRVEEFEEIGRGVSRDKWEFKDPLEVSVAREFDAVYEVPFEVWESAVAR